MAWSREAKEEPPMPRIGPFEEYSDEYDEWFERNTDLYEAELGAIRQLLPPPGASGMEVGVGSGKFAEPLGIKIGVEPSARMAMRAREKGIEVCSGVAEELPFPDSSFDFVLVVTTICFVDDVMKSLREVLRVLRADGFIIVGFVDKASHLGRRYSERREQSKFYKDATFHSATEVLEYLGMAGFEITAIRQTLVPEKPPGTILEGFGIGAFVVIKGRKNKDT